MLLKYKTFLFIKYYDDICKVFIILNARDLHFSVKVIEKSQYDYAKVKLSFN